MSIVINPGTRLPGRAIAYAPAARIAAFLLATSLALAAGATHADEGKQACMPDAKRLCSAEMKSLSRSKVKACLIVHMEQTTPVCHDYMVKARTEALSGHAPEPSSQ